MRTTRTRASFLAHLEAERKLFLEYCLPDQLPLFGGPKPPEEERGEKRVDKSRKA